MMYRQRVLRLLIVTFSTFIFSSCSESTNELASLFPHSKPSIYFKDTSSIAVEVHYEPGAEPFEGNRLNGAPYWDITEENIDSLFSYRTSTPLVSVPKTVNAMNMLPTQGKTSWTVDDVIQLYKRNHFQESTSSSAVFYIYFLNGNSSSGSGVIGFSINQTPVIAIFKSVIRASGGNVVQRFVEQSTIVHELGHAFGLVNNGIPLTSSHQDTAHGAHTTNEDCVMYWANEGLSNLQSFISKYMSTSSSVMWGPEVLADAEAFSR